MNPDATARPQTALSNKSPASASSQYPFATAPDVIRSHQKDAYFQGVLQDNLSSVLRKLYGAHFAHRHISHTQTFADILYLACTTLLGNRTLGEEYCDLIQVEHDTLKLPDIARRSGYIFSSVLIPHILSKILPGLQQNIRRALELDTSGHASQNKARSNTPWTRIRHYLLENLSTMTSPSLLYAFSLSIFYFNGAYYHVSKRLFGLRYIFTKRLEESDQRIGYEVLGVLLLLQMAVQSWLHFQRLMLDNTDEQTRSPGFVTASSDPGEIAVNDIDGENSALSPKYATSRERNTNTPNPPTPRYSLAETGTLEWIPGGQQRKCTLCLEELKDPSATTCGHVFCWTCIADWIKEKAECPLCRQAIMTQHILPLRGSYAV